MGVCRISAVVPYSRDPFRSPEKPEGVGGVWARLNSNCWSFQGIAYISDGFPLPPSSQLLEKAWARGKAQPGLLRAAWEAVAPAPAARSREVSGCQLFPPRCFGGEFGPLSSCWGLTKSDLKSTQVYIN